MSKNSKSARNVERRKQNTAARKGGGGPSRTEPKHGKRMAWFQQYETHGDYMKAQQKGGRKDRDRREKPEVVEEAKAA